MRYLGCFLSLLTGIAIAASGGPALESYHQTHLKMAASQLPEARALAAKSLPEWDKAIAKLEKDPAQLANSQMAREGAAKLSAATSDSDTIQAFGAYSEGVVAFLAADKELQKKWTRFRCPMVPKGVYSNWAQPVPESLSNPYRPEMATCGVKKPWS